MRLKPIFFALFAFLCNLAFAQDINLSGKLVDDKGMSIPGASIMVKGTSIGAKSDIDGNYSLTIPAANVPAVVTFSSVGFASQEYSFDGKQSAVSMSPVLKTSNVAMSEVVVSASKKSEKILDAPASVAVLSEERIKVNPSVTMVDHLKKVAAVDIMPTGMVSNNVNVRGFNGIFSGSLLYTIDNRFASVPSLKVNAFQLVPTSNSDISRMEIVRGPASALYGPNAANGVLAIYTKSPLDMENRAEITVSVTGALRAAGDSTLAGGPVSSDLNDRYLINPEIRIAAKITDKIGFKISGQIVKGSDFEQYDAREPKLGDPLNFGSGKNGQLFTTESTTTFQRDFSIKKQAADARLDFRPSKDVEVILSGGLSNASNFELTGLGGAQAKNWLSYNTQLRFRMKKLFMQVFMNAQESGNTYLIPQSRSQTGQWNSQYLDDQSKQIVAQIQHSSDLLKNKLNLVYGYDFIATIPESFNTIYGRFDSSDNVNQYGGYLQGEYKFSPKFSVVAAVRADYHDRINEFMLSPRGALVYKPSENNTFRITYNRAFSAPSILNLSLDLANGVLGNGAMVRGFGNPEGFQYNYNNNLPMYLNNSNTWTNLNDSMAFVSNNASTQAGIIGYLSTLGLPLPPGQLGPLVGIIYSGIAPSITNAVVDFNVFNNEYSAALMSGMDKSTAYSAAFLKSKIDPTKIVDKESVKSTVTQTVEGGYKGLLGDKVSLGIDVYYSRINNFISPLSSASYAVTYDFTNPALAQKIASNITSLGFINPGYPAAINGLFDAKTSGGNGNGTAVDEIIGLYLTQKGNNVSSPLGTVAPKNGFSGRDIILTYLNLGTVDVAGADVSVSYMATKTITVDGAFSIVNKDRIPLQDAAQGYVGLNAPKYKSSLAVSHSFGLNKGKAENFTWSANWRWYDAFPANSAIYIGTVNAANLVDLSLTWRPLTSFKNTFITLSMNNVLDNKHQFFPGTPYMGRVTWLKLSHTFGRK